LDLVWAGPTKKWHFAPKPDPLQILEGWPHVIPAICRLLAKFGWDPFSGLGEIADKIILKINLAITLAESLRRALD